MSGLQCNLKITDGTLKTSSKITSIVSKIRIIFFLIVCYALPLNTSANWYVGGSLLLHPFPYQPIHSNYLKLGSSRTDILANGISINAGYQFHLKNYISASEFEIGGFSDADGDIAYQGLIHYVNSSYYLALKQKLGFYVNPNFVLYGLFGLSENSIGDRVYNTAEYYNRKQVSFLFGGGLEYYTKRDSKIALFAECFYFTPTSMTLYSGGAKPSTAYSLSTYGTILEFGLRYYFN